MKFSDKLAKMRRANNLSQEQLADQLGVTRQSVSKWESGDSYPDMAKIIQICKVLNCSFNDIIDDDVISKEETYTKKEETKEVKYSNVKKMMDDFLDFITSTVNMFFNMSFRSKLVMIVEMAIVILLMGLLIELFHSFVCDAIWKILELLNITEYLYSILSSLLYCVEGSLMFVALIHIFKIRYLDYYVTIQDKNATKQTVEEPIIENKTANFTREKVVVIRDPEHSSSKFIDGLVSIFSFLLKCSLIIVAVPVIIGFVFTIIAIVFCIINKGIMYKGVAICFLGVAILASFILILSYGIIFSVRSNHKLLLSLLLVGLITIGVGGGVSTDAFTKLEKTDVIENYKSKIVTIDELSDKDSIYINAGNIEYIIDENKTNIEIEFSYPKDTDIYEHISNYQDDGKDYYYSLRNDFSYKTFLQDLSNNKIRDSYSGYEVLNAKVTCNSENMKAFSRSY